jgi:hypothetical protein
MASLIRTHLRLGEGVDKEAVMKEAAEFLFTYLGKFSPSMLRDSVNGRTNWISVVACNGSYTATIYPVEGENRIDINYVIEGADAEIKKLLNQPPD